MKVRPATRKANLPKELELPEILRSRATSAPIDRMIRAEEVEDV